MLFKLFCGRSWHFLLHSFISIIYILFFRSGGLVMLLFSIIISNCEDHDLFLLILLTGVCARCSCSFHLIKSCISFQPECCPILIFLVPCLSRFNQSGFNSFLSIVLVIHSFATSKVHMVFLVSLFYWNALNFVDLDCVILSSFQPLEVHWFHSFVKEAT